MLNLQQPVQALFPLQICPILKKAKIVKSACIHHCIFEHIFEVRGVSWGLTTVYDVEKLLFTGYRIQKSCLFRPLFGFLQSTDRMSTSLENGESITPIYNAGQRFRTLIP